ncbi:CPBP family intramembrane metalloprotease [soil metagenome]
MALADAARAALAYRGGMTAPWQPGSWQPVPWQPAPWQPHGWVPQYSWDPAHGWVPRWVWHPQYGWVHEHQWGPLPHPPPVWQQPSRRYTRTPHPRPTPYLHLLRTRSYGWWKSLLGLPFSVLVWLAGALVLGLIVGLLAFAGGAEDILDDLATDPLATPSTLLVTNLVLALLIPAVWVTLLVVHQERLGWVSSVVRRLRWRLLAGFGVLATALLGLGLALGLALPGGSAEGVPDPDRSTGFVVGMILAVLFTTPLQAAGEEYFFRGYLSQVIAGWIPARAVGALVAGLVTGVLFAVAHGQQSPAAFISRLVFGFTASLVVWLTGGLEAAIAYHVMNNVLLFLLDLLLGPGVLVETSGALVLLVDLTVMAAFVGAVAWWSRSRKPQRLSAPGGDAAPAYPAQALQRA